MYPSATWLKSLFFSLDVQVRTLLREPEEEEPEEPEQLVIRIKLALILWVKMLTIILQRTKSINLIFA